ncbi:hypothetical protein MANES_15G158300v8 [Manihot esculenta]|uniref:Uncharacterized protein n=1 Tax=Manihot esculenta TaxID=3983 RepID=A0ACB7GDC5_MANES|nr:hypothetical protein MANES_15G158300v8 [Manihot esculenta]
MAMLLRRAISYRNSVMLIRSCNSIIQTRNLLSIPVIPKAQILPSFDFLKDNRRGFAKGKRSKDDSAGDTVQVVPDIGPTIKAVAASQMEAAMVALSRELAKLRTGRASAGMLDHIIVETDGVKLPLNRLAVAAVIDPKTLSVNPYDPNTLKALEKAIVSSPLGLNPRVDGERLIASIPPLTKEHMQALDTIKKSGSSFSKDEVKRLEKEVDDLTKKFVKSAEDMCKAKEREITEG